MNLYRLFKVGDIMFCIRCGHELQEEDLFCGTCGQKKATVVQENDSFNDSFHDSYEEVQIIQKKEEKIEPLIDNHVIISLVFGVLCLSIILIFIMSLFTRGAEDILIIIR